MGHCFCSPDLVPSDFHLFVPVKKHLHSNRFATDADERQALNSSLQQLDIDFFCTGIKALVPRYDKCFNVNGNYVDV
jgi:hypothetical protein